MARFGPGAGRSSHRPLWIARERIPLQPCAVSSTGQTDDNDRAAPFQEIPTPGTSESPGSPVFATTHWSVVVSAQDKGSPASAQALETLCRLYWYPLYAFVRRSGQNPPDAEDLTQAFFARLLEKDYLKAALREKGRFRTFLLVALKRFLANEWDRRHAQKRGGFVPIVSIDQELAESRFAAEPADHLQPDRLFDRGWAVALLERVMGCLQEEYVTSGRARLFEQLRGVIGREESGVSYGDLAARLNLSEAAIKMAVHRLRARYREILRAEISQTVSGPEEIEDEIRHLFSVFG
jgi:RNA polymerase sigma factor (sigma-70 family)